MPAGKPVFGKRVTLPKQPVAGKPFAFTLSVTGRFSAQPLTTGTMVADPSVRGKFIKHVELFKNGKAQLSFVVPKAAKGKLLKISIKISGSDPLHVCTASRCAERRSRRRNARGRARARRALPSFRQRGKVCTVSPAIRGLRQRCMTTVPPSIPESV